MATPKKIHLNAAIDPTAQLGSGVEVGPFAVIEAGVVVGDDCWIGPHAWLGEGVTLGQRNRIYPFAAVGGHPQDLKFKGEASKLEMGDDNIIRENVTLSRGTQEGGGVTRLGSRNLFMANSHAAHDCQVGSDCVFANSVALAGHVHVGDHVTIGGLTGVHQYTRVGEHSMVGGLTRVSKEILPYSITAGCDEVKVYGPNKIGLKRRGFSRETIGAIDRVFVILAKSDLNIGDATREIEALALPYPEVARLLEFIKTSQRGIYR